MTVGEIIAALSGPAAIGLYIAVGKSVDAWRRRRDRIDQERIRIAGDIARGELDVRRAKIANDGLLSPPLLERITVLENQITQEREKREAAQQDAAQLRAEIERNNEITVKVAGRVDPEMGRSVRKTFSSPAIPSTPPPPPIEPEPEQIKPVEAVTRRDVRQQREIEVLRDSLPSDRPFNKNHRKPPRK